MVYTSKFKKAVNDVLNDEFEIERKWLINKSNIPFDLSNLDYFEIEQTYINFSPEIRVRKINKGVEYTFAEKTNQYIQDK
jgi:hypothetical protein